MEEFSHVVPSEQIVVVAGVHVVDLCVVVMVGASVLLLVNNCQVVALRCRFLLVVLGGIFFALVLFT